MHQMGEYSNEAKYLLLHHFNKYCVWLIKRNQEKFVKIILHVCPNSIKIPLLLPLTTIKGFIKFC